MKGVWCQALSVRQPPALWVGCRGPLPTGCGRGGVRAWGPITNPTERALASWLRALWGRHEGAQGGGGASCLGVGRPGSGALPPPSARPLDGLPGPTTHWRWVRGGAGVVFGIFSEFQKKFEKNSKKIPKEFQKRDALGTSQHGHLFALQAQHYLQKKSLDEWGCHDAAEALTRPPAPGLQPIWLYSDRSSGESGHAAAVTAFLPDSTTRVLCLSSSHPSSLSSEFWGAVAAIRWIHRELS